MPFTASNTAAWTIAATRLMTSGEVPPTSPARKSIWFQLVISSAGAEAAKAPAPPPTARTAPTTSVRTNVCIKPPFANGVSLPSLRDRRGSQASGVDRTKKCAPHPTGHIDGEARTLVATIRVLRHPASIELLA